MNEYGRKLILLEQKVNAIEGQQQTQPATSSAVAIQPELIIRTRAKASTVTAPVEKGRKRLNKGSFLFVLIWILD